MLDDGFEGRVEKDHPEGQVGGWVLGSCKQENEVTF